MISLISKMERQNLTTSDLIKDKYLLQFSSPFSTKDLSYMFEIISPHAYKQYKFDHTMQLTATHSIYMPTHIFQVHSHYNSQ